MLPPFIPVRKRRKTVQPVANFIHGWTVDTFPLAASGSQMQVLSMGCLEGMSVVNINKQKVAQWLKTFPGALNDLGDVPVIKRDK